VGLSDISAGSPQELTGHLPNPILNGCRVIEGSAITITTRYMFIGLTNDENNVNMNGEDISTNGAEIVKVTLVCPCGCRIWLEP
jgi:hypothetical protein